MQMQTMKQTKTNLMKRILAMLLLAFSFWGRPCASDLQLVTGASPILSLASVGSAVASLAVHGACGQVRWLDLALGQWIPKACHQTKILCAMSWTSPHRPRQELLFPQTSVAEQWQVHRWTSCCWCANSPSVTAPFDTKIPPEKKLPMLSKALRLNIHPVSIAITCVLTTEPGLLFHCPFGHVPTPVHLSEPVSCSHYPTLGIPCMLTSPLQVIKVLQLQMFHVPLLDDKRQVKSNLINILLHLPTRKAYATLLTPNDYAMPPPKLNGLRNY